jgi:CheY-like chemotaxis protein
MGQGTGLGLATVYGIITSHKGFIEVESRPGRGMRFVIHLPAIETEADRVDTPERKELPRGTETVLLVDDEPGVRQAVAQMLEYLGYRVLVAPGGKEALERYDAAAVDLVLLDMTMPGMDGGKTFERLRALNPTVKVVLASGYSRQGRVKEIAARGCKGFIQKPYSLEVLAETLRAVLDG